MTGFFCRALFAFFALVTITKWNCLFISLLVVSMYWWSSCCMSFTCVWVFDVCYCQVWLVFHLFPLYNPAHYEPCQLAWTTAADMRLFTVCLCVFLNWNPSDGGFSRVGRPLSSPCCAITSNDYMFFKDFMNYRYIFGNESTKTCCYAYFHTFTHK